MTKNIKNSSIVLLQIITVIFGFAVLIFMLWEPTIEGRNVGSTLSQIYFHDSFLMIAYAASSAFFVGLYQVFRALGFVRQNKTFSQATVKALRIIRYCAIILVSFVLAGEAYLMIVRPGDDIAGGVFMGLLLIFVFGTSAIIAKMFEKLVQNAVEIKSENDLIV
jgi:hypothetical protein